MGSFLYEHIPESLALQSGEEWHPLTAAWGSLFKTEAYHSQGAKEAAEVGGRGTCSAFPMHLINMAFSGDGPPAALREVERCVRASKLSVLKRDPHAAAAGASGKKPRSLERGASLNQEKKPCMSTHVL